MIKNSSFLVLKWRGVGIGMGIFIFCQMFTVISGQKNPKNRILIP